MPQSQCCFHTLFTISVGETHTRFSGTKQDLLVFKNEINSALANTLVFTEMPSKFDNITTG